MPVRLVSDQNFESEVLTCELPVLVDLYADWCAPCKQLEPVLEAIAAELEGKLRVVRVDVEKNPVLARGFAVRSIPMLVLIVQGRPVDQLVGAVDQNAILQMVRPFLPAEAGELEPKELAGLLAQRRALAVDVRDAASFARYRIPGAVNLPATEIMTRLSELRLSDGRVPVLYSRSTDQAKELADKVRTEGVQAAYLKGGFLYWEADDLEVERGEE